MSEFRKMIYIYGEKSQNKEHADSTVHSEMYFPPSPSLLLSL